MEVLVNSQCTSYNNPLSESNISDNIENNILFNGDGNDLCAFQLNPMLKEKFNYILNQFGNSVFPSPIHTKDKHKLKAGHCSISLPNLFDGGKHVISDKTFLYKNKLKFRYESLKNAFSENSYNHCDKKRSQSIPNFSCYTHEYFPSISTEFVNDDGNCRGRNDYDCKKVYKRSYFDTHYQQCNSEIKQGEENISANENIVEALIDMYSETRTLETKVPYLENNIEIVCEEPASNKIDKLKKNHQLRKTISKKKENVIKENHTRSKDNNNIKMTEDDNINYLNQSQIRQRGRPRKHDKNSKKVKLPIINTKNRNKNLEILETTIIEKIPNKKWSHDDQNAEFIKLVVNEMILTGNCDKLVEVIPLKSCDIKKLVSIENDNTDNKPLDAIAISDVIGIDILNTSSSKVNGTITNTHMTVYVDINKGSSETSDQKVADFRSKSRPKKVTVTSASKDNLNVKCKSKKKDVMNSNNDEKTERSNDNFKCDTDIPGTANCNAIRQESCIGRNTSATPETRKTNKVFKQPLKSSKQEKLPKFSEAENPSNLEKSSKVATEKRKKASENPPSPGSTLTSGSSNNNDDSIQYRKIRTNTYFDPKPSHWSQEVEMCGCKPSKIKESLEYSDRKVNMSLNAKSKKSPRYTPDIVFDCTDYCLNRLTYTECSSKTCPCGELCNNQNIRKLKWASGLKITNIPSKGRGVIATKLIKDGNLITEYVGEVITEETFQYRMINLYKEDDHHYCLHLDGEMLIDAYRSGSVARFVNHSCQPNCEMQKWMVNGAYRMCLFAIENIQPNTELTYDYNFCSFNTKNSQVCRCGAPNCRGFIGGRPRAEQSESQKDRKKLFYVFGRNLSDREKLFVRRRSIFLVRYRTLGRYKRLGIRRPRETSVNKLPSTITEIKQRKAKKNQFLTQMNALNSLRSIKTRQLLNAQGNENVTRTAQLGQVLRDLYNTLLEQKDPTVPDQQLVAPFINGLKYKKYPEFYRMIPSDAIVSLASIHSRLFDGKYSTMIQFDQDVLQMLYNVECYAGKQSNIGKCIERIKVIYRDLKINAIALYEALTDDMVEEKDKNVLLSNSVIQNQSHTFANPIDSNSQPKSKRRKKSSSSSSGHSKARLDRGAEVIKCVCGFVVEGGQIMVQCDQCFVWQHAYCMNIVRASESVDVTQLESYFCHICLNIPLESLVREIPRLINNLEPNYNVNHKFFWTLVNVDSEMIKIDDFVYIPRDAESNSCVLKSSKTVDFSRRIIMRIYNLWKDQDGNRWMEGGLFLRPYDSYLNTITILTPNVSELSIKRKSSQAFSFSSNKWQQNEVVYTDMVRVLPLEECLGCCNVLNTHTFRLGKPLLENNCGNDDLYVCDWLVSDCGEFKEIDPAYLKINTENYCFQKYKDGHKSNENCLYTSEDLLKFDQGSLESCNNNIKMKYCLNEDEKIILKKERLFKLVTKLSEFAFERTRKLPLSSQSSNSSRSTASSRGTSPQCDNVDSKFSSCNNDEIFHHYPRKQLLPKKIITKSNCDNSKTTRKSIKRSNTITDVNNAKTVNNKKLKALKNKNKESIKEVSRDSRQSHSLVNEHLNGSLSVVASQTDFEQFQSEIIVTPLTYKSAEDDNSSTNLSSGKCPLMALTTEISISSFPTVLSTVNRSLSKIAANDFTSIESIASS